MSPGLLVRIDDLEEVADVAVRFDRVPQRLVSDHLVTVPAADLFAADELAPLEVSDDPLNGTLGDPDPFGDLA